MTAPPAQPPVAWQPLTPHGVAAFAHARSGRLFALQFVVAALAAASVIWFLRTAWFPVVTEGIQALPAEGQIRGGVLIWHGESPTPLAERHFLSLVVDLDHTGSRRSPAQIQVEFGRRDCVVLSLLGARTVPYPPGTVIAFGRSELEPLWGAWRPILLWITVVAVMVGLLFTWGALATLYTLPVYLAGWLANRDLKLAGSWRVAGAAMMPGALVMTLAIVLYGLGVLDLIRLGVALAAHLVIGWVYLAAGTLAAPRYAAAPPEPANPFAAASATESQAAEPAAPPSAAPRP